MKTTIRKYCAVRVIYSIEKIEGVFRNRENHTSMFFSRKDKVGFQNNKPKDVVLVLRGIEKIYELHSRHV